MQEILDAIQARWPRSAVVNYFPAIGPIYSCLISCGDGYWIFLDQDGGIRAHREGLEPDYSYIPPISTPPEEVIAYIEAYRGRTGG